MPSIDLFIWRTWKRSAFYLDTMFAFRPALHFCGIDSTRCCKPIHSDMKDAANLWTTHPWWKSYIPTIPVLKFDKTCCAFFNPGCPFHSTWTSLVILPWQLLSAKVFSTKELPLAGIFILFYLFLFSCFRPFSVNQRGGCLWKSQ